MPFQRTSRVLTLVLFFCAATAFNSFPVKAITQEVPTEQGSVVDLDWGAREGRRHQLSITRDGEATSYVTQGGDPYFFFTIPPLGRGESDWMLEIEYFCPSGIDGLEWRSGSTLHRPQATAMKKLPAAEGWTTYVANLSELAGTDLKAGHPLQARIDLGHVPQKRLQIRRVVARPMSLREKEDQENAEAKIRTKQMLAEKINAYRGRGWTSGLDSAGIEGNQMIVTGHLGEYLPGSVPFLVSREPDSVSAEAPTERELKNRWPIKMTAEARFRIEIPIETFSKAGLAGRRFQLISLNPAEPDRCHVLSAARNLEPAVAETLSPPPELKAAKGLTCITARFSSDQLRSLGLKHASVNLVVSGLVSESPREGWKQAFLLGENWWVNERRLRALDRDVRTSSDAGIVVAGILLIPTSKNGPGLIEHPESTSAGTYAMPNLTTPASTRHYAAALELIGRRYSGRSPEHGRIDHWIVHNEIDYGWQWTNMGEQPMELFLDHYVRSMRIVDFSVRSHNPHASVFVSLTHRWNTTDNRHWKTYPPREILRWLNRDSRIEGDFAWGVAYHPYPQSLWKAETWTDTKVTDDFDTPLITIKNLHVLDRFMHLPTSLHSDGSVRPVLCSEQGFHAEQDSPERLRIQAAALLYTFQKLRRCPSILAFDYHRPSDHPQEGGLRLGLRGLPDKDNPIGPPKPAWQVYSDIGTDREASWVDEYRTLWESAAPASADASP